MIFSDTRFEFPAHCAGEFEDLLDELEHLLALERRKPSPHAMSANRDINASF